MALQIKDRVKETTATTGSGDITLAGAVLGFQAFSAVCADGDTFWYALQAIDGNGNPAGDWEVGLGTYHASGNTFTRTTIYASSNSGSVVTLGAGTKQVWIGMPAEKAFDAVGTVTGNAPAASQFTLTANSTATASLANLASGRGCALKNTQNSTALDAQACAGVAVSGNWTITALLSLNMGLSSVYATWGLYARDTAGATAGKLAKFGGAGTNITGFPGASYDKWSSFPNGSYSARNIIAGGMAVDNPIWMRLKWDGTNYTFSTSTDGETFLQLYQIAGSDWISAPAEAGIVLDNSVGLNANAAITILSFLKTSP